MNTLRLLHTSDWHLGHRLYGRERRAEHDEALSWLLATIRAQQIDVLLISGDVFDSLAPPTYALRQYYNFLNQVRLEGRCHVVVIGGNHDSPAVLNAPKELLHPLNIHVIGLAYSEVINEIVHLSLPNAQAVIAAVPFLRERDLKTSQAGETYQQREQAIRQGIYAHYQAVMEAARPLTGPDVPLIATGHLFATGMSATESEKSIYVGNLGQITFDQFPPEFAYIALGHLHRRQSLAAHIHYSGSLLPLSFGETNYNQQVLRVDFTGAQLTQVTPLNVPRLRDLFSLRGTLHQVIAQLKQLTKTDNGQKTWVEILLNAATLPDARPLYELAAHQSVEILRITLIKPQSTIAPWHEVELNALSVEAVFQRKCHAVGITDCSSQLARFQQLQQWMQEQSADNL